MHKPLTMALAAAVLVLMTVVGVRLFTALPSVGGPSSASTPSPIPSPRAMRDGRLAPGTYTSSFGRNAPEVIFTVPDGWTAYGNWAVLGPGGSDAPDGAAIAFSRPTAVFNEPCNADGRGGVPVDDPEGFIAALRAANTAEVSEPRNVTFGGYDGLYVDVELPPTPGCRSEQYFLWSDSAYSQGPGDRWRVRAVDVAGDLIVIYTVDHPRTPAARLSELEQIAESVQIHPDH
jgi:hypothetical protein